MLLLMHVGADRTLSGFDCGGSDSAVAWAARARCFGNADRYDPHRCAHRGRVNLRGGRREIPVGAEKVKAIRPYTARLGINGYLPAEF
jgi:hypothetical protein